MHPRNSLAFRVRQADPGDRPMTTRRKAAAHTRGTLAIAVRWYLVPQPALSLGFIDLDLPSLEITFDIKDFRILLKKLRQRKTVHFNPPNPLFADNTGFQYSPDARALEV